MEASSAIVLQCNSEKWPARKFKSQVIRKGLGPYLRLLLVKMAKPEVIEKEWKKVIILSQDLELITT